MSGSLIATIITTAIGASIPVLIGLIAAAAKFASLKTQVQALIIEMTKLQDKFDANIRESRDEVTKLREDFRTDAANQDVAISEIRTKLDADHEQAINLTQKVGRIEDDIRRCQQMHARSFKRTRKGDTGDFAKEDLA